MPNCHDCKHAPLASCDERIGMCMHFSKFEPRVKPITLTATVDASFDFGDTFRGAIYIDREYIGHKVTVIVEPK